MAGHGDKVALPSITFGWLGDKNEFQAGDTAIIKIKLLENPLRDRNTVFSRDLLNFTLSVNGKKGNNSYISGVIQYLDNDPVLEYIIYYHSSRTIYFGYN